MWNKGRNTGNALMTMVIRHFSSSSRSRAPNLKKINPKVPYQEATYIAEDLYGVIKTNGPLTVSDTWNCIKEGGVSGVSSKTHMKLMLKWMQGKNMLKQVCQQVGSGKRFLITTLPEDPNNRILAVDPTVKIEKSSRSRKKKSKKASQKSKSR